MPARPPPGVAVMTLEARSIPLTRHLPGRSSAFLKADVRPQVSGIVADRLFREGSVVAEGEPLYQLDDALYRAELESARADLARYRATQVTTSRAAERAEALREKGSISQQELDDRLAADREAKAAVRAAQAAVNASQVRLDFARITAPISGTISRSNVTRGALVTADQSQPLATVQQTDPMYVDFTRSAAEWLALRDRLAAGQLQEPESAEITLTLEDGSEYPHVGQLLFSEVTVSPETGSLVLRAEFPNPDGALLPGMFVRGEVSLGTRQNALLVPQRALARDSGGNAYVFLLNDDQTVFRRMITTEQAVDADWLVSEGLDAGDRVVVSGIQNLRDGIRVDVRSAPGATSGT